MQVTVTVKPPDRAAWRAWLEEQHATAKEIWLLFDDRPEVQSLPYLDAVEEAICFGWIDSTGKRISSHEVGLWFAFRRLKGNWSELNKERARRLIRLGLMIDAGRAILLDLDKSFVVVEDIAAAIKVESGVWANFEAFPDLYRRVRIGNIDQMRKNRTEFERRLRSFVAKTALNQMFGNWNDGGRLASPARPEAEPSEAADA